MPILSALSTIDFPHRIAQQEVKTHARKLFEPSYPQIERLMGAFDNTEIITRNFCKPIQYYGSEHSFTEQNKDYISITVEYAIKAIEDCISKASIPKESITDIIFVSTTGLATPSIDAQIINKLRLSPNINRLPIFGLGCAGGVGAFAKANTIALANPDAIVLVVVAELCSLTFLRNDFSKSNLIGSSLFADGICASIIMGDSHKANSKSDIRILGSLSKLYYDSLDVMGWDFQDNGFKVLFSKDIPTIISENIQKDIETFLTAQNVELSQIKNFIFHPGGKKVLNAYAEALAVPGDFLKNTRALMNDNGNMSAPTVLYVLDRFLTGGFEDGYGLMVAMGPGFSSEMVLLAMKNNP
jgi:alkylresorcinol/alkylpyrone synthase